MDDTRQIRNLALTGFMGCGKSTIGRQVARELKFDFVDTDGLIEEHTGRTIAEIFEHAGEAAFRKLENEVVRQLEARQGVVIATGGGLVEQPGNLDGLKRHALVVCLWASVETIWERTRHQTHRPLLQTADPQASIRELLARREPYYKQADVIVNTEFRPIREVAGQVKHQFLESRRKVGQ